MKRKWNVPAQLHIVSDHMPSWPSGWSWRRPPTTSCKTPWSQACEQRAPQTESKKSYLCRINILPKAKTELIIVRSNGGCFSIALFNWLRMRGVKSLPLSSHCDEMQTVVEYHFMSCCCRAVAISQLAGFRFICNDDSRGWEDQKTGKLWTCAKSIPS